MHCSKGPSIPATSTTASDSAALTKTFSSRLAPRLRRGGNPRGFSLHLHTLSIVGGSHFTDFLALVLGVLCHKMERLWGVLHGQLDLREPVSNMQPLRIA